MRKSDPGRPSRTELAYLRVGAMLAEPISMRAESALCASSTKVGALVVTFSDARRTRHRRQDQGMRRSPARNRDWAMQRHTYRGYLATGRLPTRSMKHSTYAPLG